MSHDAEDRALLDTMSGYLGHIQDMGEDERLHMLGLLVGALSRRLGEAPALRSAEVTLATIRDTAARHAPLPFATEHGQGYRTAMRDVLAILDARWLPERAPVILGGQS
jgi:hypothetical protein